MTPSRRGDKSICLPVKNEAEYDAMLNDPVAFRGHVLTMFEMWPEVFPEEMVAGFRFHGFVESRKMKVTIRRILIVETGQAYQLRPDFVMPYMVGRTEEMEKGLYLCMFGESFEHVAYACGGTAMKWYRAFVGLGRFSLVGTTVKTADVPVHLVADEKHTWWNEARVYVATTVAEGVFLGAELRLQADTEALTAGYGAFAAETRALDAEYQPVTVTTDGWDSTQAAWTTLYPRIVLMLCYLHSILKIRDRCRSLAKVAETVLGLAWNAYRATSEAQFTKRLKTLRAWARNAPVSVPLTDAVLALCDKADLFSRTFTYPDAPRTSNAVDRLINHLDRCLFRYQYFHGERESARLAVRALALTWNFHPYGRRTRCDNPNKSSPFKDLNGFEHHANWLRNLLIAGSLAGRRRKHKKR
jgi:hypothetical protein